MEKARVLEKLIAETGLSKRAFAEKCGIPVSTLYTILKRGVGGASVNIMILICQQLGISVEELDIMAAGEKKEAYEPTFEDTKKLIARNGKNLTTDQKMELIKLLSEIK